MAETGKRPTRAIAEDRYDGMLLARCSSERPFTDSQVGEINKRWLKLTGIIGDLIDGTARGDEQDQHGDILETCLRSLRETIVSGVSGEPAR